MAAAVQFARGDANVRFRAAKSAEPLVDEQNPQGSHLSVRRRIRAYPSALRVLHNYKWSQIQPKFGRLVMTLQRSNREKRRSRQALMEVGEFRTILPNYPQCFEASPFNCDS